MSILTRSRPPGKQRPKRRNQGVIERIDLVPEQLAAVAAFEALPEADALAAANKRIVNILRKSGAEASAIVDAIGPGHRVACPWAEDIMAGRIQPRPSSIAVSV